jgi:AraC-type DNA-binding domain-containing proteins
VVNFSIIKPSPLLAPFVSHYWTLKAGGAIPAGERVIPTGSVSLIFHKADLMMSLTEGKTQPRSFLSGISTGYSDLQGSGELDMLVVVFHPLGGRTFFNTPLGEFRNMNVPVGDVGDTELTILSEKILEERDTASAVGLIERFLISRLGRHEIHIYSRIGAAMREINRNPETSVSQAAAIACLSDRQFGRIFSEQVGTRPKDFMRIVRFQRALHTMQSEPGANPAQLAAGCGYYDQAHMIKDFRRFSGYTPLEYISVCAPYSDYFSETV